MRTWTVLVAVFLLIGPDGALAGESRKGREIREVMKSDVLLAADQTSEEGDKKKGDAKGEKTPPEKSSAEPMEPLEKNMIRATGPITSKIHHPFYFGLLFPTPDRADLVPQGKWDVNFNLNYSNILFGGEGRGWLFDTDFEVGEFDLDLSYGVRSWVQVGVEIPAYYFSGGFMDNFVEGFHDVTGFKGSSHLPPAFSYTFNVFTNGQKWGVPDHGELGLGDVTLYGKFQLYKDVENQAYLALKILSQPPTGNSSRGIGTGYWDNGVMLLGEKGYGKFFIHANAGGFIYDKMERGDVKIELDPIATGFLGFEYKLSNRWAFHLQSLIVSNPIKDEAGDKGVDRYWQDITFGTKIRIGPTHLTLGLSENITETAPDFTIITSLQFVK